MRIFAQRQLRPETAFDRKARAVFERRFTPTEILVVTAIIFLCSAWSFTVVFFGWPRDWARLPYVLSVFVAPAFGYASARDIFRHGWNIRVFLAAALGIVGFGLVCATTYLIIHPNYSR